MRYAYVKDKVVVEGPRALPKSWGNTSGFNLLSQAELLQLGWLPWRLVEVPAPSNDWAMDNPTIQITPTEIIETQTYRLKTQEEKDADEASRIDFKNRLRQEAYRNEADPLFFKSERGEATREEWLAKVQEIRDRYPV